MPQDDLAAQWKSFDQEKRTRLLGKMTPEQKKILRSKLEAKPATAATPASPQNPGFFKSMIGDIAGILHPSGFNPYPGMGQEEKSAAATDAYQQDQERKKAGYSLPYRALVPVAESVGVNVSGMEESARQGDEAGVLGHAAAVPAVMAVGEGLSKVGELRKSVGEKMQPFARKFTEVEPALKDAVTKAAEKHAGATEVYDTTKKLDEQSVALKGHLTKVEQSVKAAADAKFDAVRDKLGVTDENPGPAVAPDTLVATVKHAQQQTLQGIPENMKEFNAILKSEGLPDNIADAYRAQTGEEPEGAEQLTWSKLQSIKSRLDARLRAGISNGDVYRSVRDVRDAVVDEQGKLATEHGAAPEWKDAKNMWMQYKQDFHEPSGPSGSGSPVAQSLRAVDPKNIRDPFTRKQSTVGNRGVDILNKYPEHGGTEAAKAAGDLLETHGALETMPKSKGVTRPPATPVVDAAKVAREAIAKKAKNWGNFNARDIGILSSGYIGGLVEHVFKGGGFEFPAAVTAYEAGKFGASRALGKPGVIEWLSKTPQAELDVLPRYRERIK